MPTLREHIADDGFVGLADLRQPGEHGRFPFAAQAAVEKRAGLLGVGDRLRSRLLRLPLPEG